MLSHVRIILFLWAMGPILANCQGHGYQNNPSTRPLTQFLECPVTSFEIVFERSGCFDDYSESLVYKIKTDSSMATRSRVYRSSDDTGVLFSRIIQSKNLKSTLEEVNTTTNTYPSLSDFSLDSNDIISYLHFVRTLTGDDQLLYWLNYRKIDTSFYHNTVANLNNIDSVLLTKVLNMDDDGYSTLQSTFSVKFINTESEELIVERSFFTRYFPSNIPWTVKYRNTTFLCYNPHFSEFIKSCIPDNFQSKEIFENKYLILKIADYLWDNK